MSITNGVILAPSMCCWARHNDAHLWSTNTDTTWYRHGHRRKRLGRQDIKKNIYEHIYLYILKTLLLWTLILQNELINHFNIWRSSNYYLLANLLPYHNPYLLRKKNRIIKSVLQNSLCVFYNIHACPEYWVIDTCLLHVRCVCHVFTYSHRRTWLKFPTCV